MIEDVSTFEELSDYWSRGDGTAILDKAAGPGLRHTSAGFDPVVFTAGSSSEFWFGHVTILAPDRETDTDYVSIMKERGILLTARANLTDHTTPRMFRKLQFSFVMVKADWTLMAVREKLSAS